jgi:hypothetical protein
MSTSDKKIKANRINGARSHGPKNTSSTRFNAVKHGLLSVGLTEMDHAEGYRTILQGLIAETKPLGIFETQLVEAAAFDLVRWQRARRFEAGFITQTLNPPKRERDALGDTIEMLDGPVVDPGIPTAIGAGTILSLLNYQRYEAGFAKRLFRTLHEFERLQRMRQGEHVPAPVTVDVSVHAKTVTQDLTPTAIQQSQTPSANGESLPAPVTGASNKHPDNEVMELVPAESPRENSARAEWKAGTPSGPIWSRR